MPTISPFLIVYDGSDVRNLGLPGLTANISGPDQRLRTLGNANSPRNGGDRQYGFANTKWAENGSAWHRTHEAFFRRSLRNLWWGGANTAQRYNISAYAAMARGDYDARFRALVQSLPIGTSGPGPKRPPINQRWHEFRFPVMHEPDIYTNMSLPEHRTDPAAVMDAYKAGIHRVLRVMIEAAVDKGAHPAEFAAGGLLAGSDREAKPNWRWWQGMPKDLKASKFVGHFWDEYFAFNSAGQPQSFRARVNNRVEEFRAEGGWAMLRPILGETAIGYQSAGNPDVMTGHWRGQIAWLSEIEEWITNGVGEGVALFHAPTGAASYAGSFFTPGRVPAAEQLAYAMNRINIKNAPPLDPW